MQPGELAAAQYLLNTNSSPCFSVKIFYNHGLRRWKRTNCIFKKLAQGATSGFICCTYIYSTVELWLVPNFISVSILPPPPPKKKWGTEAQKWKNRELHPTGLSCWHRTKFMSTQGNQTHILHKRRKGFWLLSWLKPVVHSCLILCFLLYGVSPSCISCIGRSGKWIYTSDLLQLYKPNAARPTVCYFRQYILRRGSPL
jgi:hypothetical protein